jgi:hypothetical protein
MRPDLAHVEGAEHVEVRDVAALLDQREQGRDDPGAAVEPRRDAIRQDAGHVLDESAAGDVRDAAETRKHRLECVIVRAVNGEQCIAERGAERRVVRVEGRAVCRGVTAGADLEDLPHERVPVRVQPVRR